MDNLPDPKPSDRAGDYLRTLAGWLRRHAIRVAPGGGLRLVQTPGGQVLSAEADAGFWARLTASSGGGAYSFTRVTEAASGGWTNDSTLTGTCYETNGNASLAVGASTGKVVRLTVAKQTASYRFTKGSC